MTNVTALDLGKVGLAYIEDYLKGWGGIAEAIAEHFPTLKQALALVPEDTSADRARQFNMGGLKLGYAEMKWFTQHFMELYMKYPDTSLIMQDTAAKSTDKWIETCDDKMFFYKEKVYTYLNCDDFNENSLDDLFFRVCGFFKIGFFLDCKVAVEQKQEVDASIFDTYIKNVKQVFVGAYDSESFILGC